MPSPPRVPRPSEGRRSVQELCHHRVNVGYEHELVRSVDRTDEFCFTILLCRDEEVTEQTSFDTRPVEIRQAQDSGSNPGGGVRFQDTVFLFLALPSLEGMRLLWMILCHTRTLRPAENVQRTDKEQAVNLF